VNLDVTITGIADVNRTLRIIAPNEAKNILRATIFELAKDFAKDAAQRVPKDQGVLAGAVKAKRERGTRDTLAATVRVGKQAFYWRFLEYGQGPDHIEHAMFLQTLQALRPDLDRRYLEIFVKKLLARLARQRKKSGA
jgi:Bacteriophage HK97-gp10, putative tail-component